MAINGKFILTGTQFSPLILLGIGHFMAFSGNNHYRNRPACASIPFNGPLPLGLYYIVKRPTNGVKSMLYNMSREFWSWPGSSPVVHAEWFGLFRHDALIDDYTFIEGIKRGNFRLHPIGPAGISQGCITLQYRSDFLKIRQALMTYTYGNKNIPGTSFYSYGTIEVIDGSVSDACSA